MFSKTKINETQDKMDTISAAPKPAPSAAPSSAGTSPAPSPAPTFQAKPKPTPSLISSDLTIKGNVLSSGDIQIEGTVEGDVRAHLLTVGETAEIRGEITADDVVVNGKVIGRVRGLKVRLTSSARVEGDIVHKTIAIESGAHFEGSVQRQEDPLGNSSSSRPTPRVASDAAAG